MIFPIISAIEFDIKSEFKQGETLIAKVSGNFVEPILKNNIFFYRGHVRAPIEYDVTKIDNEFYIYALLPATQNNYSILIENAQYMEGKEVIDEDIVRNFSITDEVADFSANPGFIIAKDDFFIEVQNLQDKKISIKSNIDEDVVDLISGEIKKIYFDFDSIEEQTKTIELSSDSLVYEIPLYVFSNKTKDRERDFKFEPSIFDVSMSTNSETTRVVYIKNIGKETLEYITLSISDSLKPYVSFSAEEIKELKEDSDIKIEIYLSSDSEERLIEGQITAKESNGTNTIYAYSALSLNFLKDYVPLDGEVSSTSATCLELEGNICETDNECSGDIKYAKDGICCLGECKRVEEGSIGKLIGWLIVLVIIGFLYWFFKNKYRGTKKDINLLKIAKGKK